MRLFGDDLMIRRVTPAFLLLLSACGGQSDQAGEPKDGATPTPTPTEPVSIIRPEIEEAAEIPLESLNVTIGFPDGGAELDDKAVAALEKLIQSRQQREGVPIILGGHSDAGGRDEINLRVSRQRAEAVAEWLVENGVAEGRITVIAFGEQNPIKPNALPDGSPNEVGRAANRRVVVRLQVAEGAMVSPEPTPEPSVAAGSAN
ncbi:OmpA family protein [Qipengyuania sp. CAU 1752]